MSIEAMKQMIEALENTLGFTGSRQIDSATRQAIQAGRQAIARAEHLEAAVAEQHKKQDHEWVCGECIKCGASIEKQTSVSEVEPVAWMDRHFTCDLYKNKPELDVLPLYTHPYASQPKREPLTIEQLLEHWRVAKVLDMTDAEIDFADYVLIARDVEALYGITSDMKQEHVAKTAKQRHEENT